MSEFADAWTALRAECEDASAVSQKVTIAGTEYDAIIGETTYDEIVAPGGDGESGGYSVQVRKDDFTAIPEKLSAIAVNGIALQILSVVDHGAVLTIQAGEPAIE